MANTTDEQQGGTTRGDWLFYGVLVTTFIGLSLLALREDGGLSFTSAEKGGKWLPLGVGHNWETLGLFIGAGITFSLYSFLYKDNPFFKAMEHIYVGVGLGYSIVIAWFQYVKAELYYPLVKYWVRDHVPGTPDYKLIVPMVLGAFLLARLIRPISWLSRFAFAFIIGFGAGVAIPNVIQATLLRQIEPTVTIVTSGGWFPIANTALILVGVVSVLIYFFFSVEHKGAVGVVSKLGIWFLMISFGASFGYTVMGRMALLVGRIQFLSSEWLHLGMH